MTGFGKKVRRGLVRRSRRHRDRHNGGVTPDRPDRADRSRPRARMTGPERREQLIAVGRKLFADKGFEATTVEEVASRANVSKPVVYEHFGGK